MEIKKHEPDELDIRMSKFRNTLNDYLDARAVGLSAQEEFGAFERLYCEVAKIFEDQIGELATKNLKAQHKAATANATLRRAVTLLLSIVEAEYSTDPEPEDLPSWKEAIDAGNAALETKAVEDPLLFRVVFDGPPGPEPGRFVEVEDLEGHSISKGRWVEDVDFWYLVFDGRDS